MFKESCRLAGEHLDAVNYSPFFWHHTQQAYIQTALVYLHRIYDQHWQSFNLPRFLLTIREYQSWFDSTEVRKRLEGNPSAENLIRAIGSLDPVKLDEDIRFSSHDEKVKNLKAWRDRVTFHKDERELFRSKPFEKDHPLPYADIEELLDKGFQILNRYSQYFDTSIYSEDGCREWKDMKFVFEAIEHHPNLIQRREHDKLEAKWIAEQQKQRDRDRDQSSPPAETC